MITGKRVSGLYIIDIDNALALLNNSPNHGYADLASINFKTLQITYKTTFPYVFNMGVDLIVSPSEYYTISRYQPTFN